MLSPYYDQGGITIYNGDCRDILPQLEAVDSIITDPVWPNAKADIPGKERPYELLCEALIACKTPGRLILQLGCDSDPRILCAVPDNLPFFRVCWLEYACPTRKGRLLYTGDVAYVFGVPPKSAPHRRVMPGRYMSTRPDARRATITKHKEFGAPVEGNHPCPRRLQHVQWLVGRWADGDVLDPFCGSGTTLLAAKTSGRKAIGIEIVEKYCEIAAKRLAQDVFDLTAPYFAPNGELMNNQSELYLKGPNA